MSGKRVLPRYFPEGALSDSSVAWYAKQLYAMDEPSISKRANEMAIETYRFTWLRTFHAPFAFRMEVTADGGALVRIKSTSGKGGYEPGRVVLDKTINVGKEQVDRFKSMLVDFGFWSLPATDSSRGGYDGAEWVFEGLKDGRYHVVERWSPEEGTFRLAMLELVRLGGVDVRPIY
jgi:hypothetical protein